MLVDRLYGSINRGLQFTAMLLNSLSDTLKKIKVKKCRLYTHKNISASHLYKVTKRN